MATQVHRAPGGVSIFGAAQQRAAGGRGGGGYEPTMPRPQRQSRREAAQGRELYSRLHEQAQQSLQPTPEQIRDTSSYQMGAQRADEWSRRMGHDVGRQLEGAGVGRGGSAYRAATGLGQAHQQLLGQAEIAGRGEWQQQQAQEWNRIVQGAGFAKGLADTGFQQQFSAYMAQQGLNEGQRDRLLDIVRLWLGQQRYEQEGQESDIGWQRAVAAMQQQANPYA